MVAPGSSTTKVGGGQRRSSRTLGDASSVTRRRGAKTDSSSSPSSLKMDRVVERYLNAMELYEQIGQMSQIDINMLLEDFDGGKRLNHALVERYIGELAIGSVLNAVTNNGNDPQHQWTARQYREAAIALNQVATQYGRPPVIWGLDSVHGANYIQNAILTPQPLNIAATFNISMAYQAGQLASRDTRAAGIHWLFAPLLGLAVEPRWSRVYETFGEDPVVVGEMATQMIRGIQEPQADTIPSQAAACAKHYIGYSMPRTGHDRSPSWIPTRHLYQYFVPPWRKVLSTSSSSSSSWSIPKTVMESYTETDGVPMVANYDALQYLLRQRLGFTGVVVTDYQEMFNLHTFHHVTNTNAQAVIESLRQSSVDVSMIPWDPNDFASSIVAGIQQQPPQHKGLTLDRIRTSAARVLQLKRDLRMLPPPIDQDDERDKDDDDDGDRNKQHEIITIVDPNLDLVGSDEADVYPMVLDSIILTQNRDELLPLDVTQPLKVHVTGPTANSLRSQTGGWTGQWQGVPADGGDESQWFSYGSTVWDSLHALENNNNNNNDNKNSAWHVTYSCGVDILGHECHDDDETGPDQNYIDKFTHWAGLTPTNSMAMAVEGAQDADVVVICLGEEPYTEKPGDIRSLRLPVGQYDLVHAIQRNAGNTKIVLVYFGGRPRLLADIVPSAVDAVMLGFLPGPSAGQAVVDILTGRHNPSGRLPISYPAAEDGGGVPYWHAVTDLCTRDDDENAPLPHWEYIPCPVQWNFGHGLSYTSFSYSDLSAVGGIDDDLHVTVTVTNTGSRKGADTVLFFTFDEARVTTPEYKRLRAFEKVVLAAGQSQTIRKTVPVDELRFVGPHDDRHYILDPHMISYLGVGFDTDCRIRDDNHNPDKNDLCVRLQSVAPDKPYVAACKIACQLWEESECGDEFNMSQEQCLELCMAIEPTELPASESGWGFNYVRCIEPLVWSIRQQRKQNGSDRDGDGTRSSCWMMTSLCRDIFQTGRLTSSGTAGVSWDVGPVDNVACGISSERGTPASWLALVSALMASLFIAKMIGGALMKGGGQRCRETDEERFNGIQFTTISNNNMG